MNLIENFKEGLRSIQANLLRSVLTALIVAIGITSLVGILTAIDGIEQSVTESLSSLGVNVFDISSKNNRGNNQGGVKETVYQRLQLSEAQKFIDRFTLEVLSKYCRPTYLFTKHNSIFEMGLIIKLAPSAGRHYMLTLNLKF